MLNMKKEFLERRRFSVKRLIQILAASLLFTAAVTGCSGTAAEETTVSDAGSESSEDTGASNQSSSPELPQTDEDMFTERDKKTEYDEDSSVRIELNGSTAAASSDSVKISGTAGRLRRPGANSGYGIGGGAGSGAPVGKQRRLCRQHVIEKY